MRKSILVLLLLGVSFVTMAGRVYYIPKINVKGLDRHRFWLDSDQLYLTGYSPGLQALIVEPQLNAGNPLASTFYRDLIDTLVVNDVNLLRVVLTMGMALEDREWLHPYERSSTCCTKHADDLDMSRFRFDLDRFNETFFDYWDAVLSYAEARDVVMQVALLDGAHTSREFLEPNPPLGQPFDVIGYYYDYFDEDNNDNGLDVESKDDWYDDADIRERQKAFIRKAVQELGDHDNVIWEIINEGQIPRPPPNGPGDPWLDEMQQEILAAQNDFGHRLHLIQPFSLPDHRDLSGHNTPGNTTDPEDYLAEYQAVHEGLVQDYADNDQPLLDDNDCCARTGTPEQLRKKAWLSLVSGAYPSMLAYTVTGGSAPTLLGIGDPGHPTQQGMRWVGYTKTFVEDLEVDLVGMAPSDELLDATSGGPAWGLARAEEEYVVYFFEGGSTSIPSLAGLTYDSYWFNPVNGDFLVGPTMGTSFTTPTSGDWALHIRGGVSSIPLAPTNVEASDDLPDRIRVTWDPVLNATSYWVYRKTVLWRPGPPSGLPIATTTEPSFDDLETEPCFSKVYYVKAVNTSGVSDFSQAAAGQFGVRCHYDDLAPTADAWVQEEAPDANHGFGQELRVRSAATGNGRYVFLRFDVPEYSTLFHAHVSLIVQDTAIPGLDFYLVSGMSWDEGTVTWNNWHVGDVTYEILGSVGPLEPEWGASIDLNGAITEPGEITIGIATSHDLEGLDLWSRESSQRPGLQLTYIE